MSAPLIPRTSVVADFLFDRFSFSFRFGTRDFDDAEVNFLFGCLGPHGLAPFVWLAGASESSSEARKAKPTANSMDEAAFERSLASEARAPDLFIFSCAALTSVLHLSLKRRTSPLACGVQAFRSACTMEESDHSFLPLLFSGQFLHL